MSLVEVMIASLLFSLAILPAVALMTTSQREVVKVQSRMLATHLAMSVVEELRSRPVAQRITFGATDPRTLPHLTPLFDAQRALDPAGAAAIDTQLASFRCSATVGPGTSPYMQSARATVTWTEKGEPQSLELDAQLDQP